MTVPAVLIGGQLAGWLAGRVPQDALRRFLAGFLILLALLTIVRAILNAGISAMCIVLFGLVGTVLWRRSALKAKLCYTSGRYYCP